MYPKWNSRRWDIPRRCEYFLWYTYVLLHFGYISLRFHFGSNFRFAACHMVNIQNLFLLKKSIFQKIEDRKKQLTIFISCPSSISTTALLLLQLQAVAVFLFFCVQLWCLLFPFHILFFPKQVRATGINFSHSFTDIGVIISYLTKCYNLTQHLSQKWR